MSVLARACVRAQKGTDCSTYNVHRGGWVRGTAQQARRVPADLSSSVSWSQATTVLVCLHRR